MELDNARCMLCNGTCVKIGDQVWQCMECNYLNHHSK